MQNFYRVSQAINRAFAENFLRDGSKDSRCQNFRRNTQQENRCGEHGDRRSCEQTGRGEIDISCGW